MAHINKGIFVSEDYSKVVNEVLPGQSYGVRDLVERALSGMLPPMAIHDSYDGDNPSIDENVEERTGEYDYADASSELDAINQLHNKSTFLNQNQNGKQKSNLGDTSPVGNGN